MQLVKTQLRWFVCCVVFFSAIPFIALYAYDPLQVFHKHFFSTNYVHGNMRQQAAGLINSYEFDSMILGTSMMKGSSASFTSELMGETFANLSADGSTWFERSIILDYALRNKQLETVIFSLDTGLDVHAERATKKYPLKNFSQVYDRNPFNDILIYWNSHYLECLLALSQKPDCVGNRRGLQRDRGWFKDIFKINQRISGVEGWLGEKGRGLAVSKRLKRQIRNRDRADLIASREQTWRAVANTNLMPLVEANPSVTFKFVFPPYSRFYYSFWRHEDPAKYADYQKVIEYFAVKATELKNVEVFIFDDLPYTADLDNYRDMRHYNIDMNEQMVVNMADGKGRIDETNMNEYLKRLDALNQEYLYLDELQMIRNSYK